MQISSPPETRQRLPQAVRPLVAAWTALIVAATLAATIVPPASAQTLARPGWVGSGLASEPWWRNAVFYRLVVSTFQDSDGDGRGDLRGVIQRLDYLQSLGIDAIVLSPSEEDSPFGDLVREAGTRHIRIVIELGTGQANLVSQARLWLTRGAAGISVEGSFRTAEDQAQAHLRDLRALTGSFPGERVLIARPIGSGQVLEPGAAQLVGQIIDMPQAILPKPITNSEWQAARAPLPAGGLPLLQSGKLAPDMFGDTDPLGRGMAKIVAARLLTMPGAAAFEWRQELGLASPPGEVVSMVMQWTPSNITPPASPPSTPDQPQALHPPSDPNVYTAFKPYIAPKPVSKPLLPGQVALIDPDLLPGFTSGALKTGVGYNAKTANVAVEDADPRSLLNFYRRLIQLHHGNASIRSGTVFSLNRDAEKALVWLRRAPANAHTAGTVVVAANLSENTLTLTLDTDLTHLHIPTGTLRPLAASWTATPFAQYTNHIVLPPYSVYLGELSR